MQKAEFRPVAREHAESFAPGDAPPDWVPGDFVLTHGNAWTSKLIRFGQRLRIRGDDRKYTYWNHAALVVSADGEIIEALGAGVTRRKVSVYRPREYTVVRITASPEDRAQAVRFARWAAGEVDPLTGMESTGEGSQRVPYGYLTILSIAFTLLVGGRFTFALDGQEICSGMVARAMERTGAIFSNRGPSHIMPADLAKFFSVPLPETA